MYNGWFKITFYQIHTDYRIINTVVMIHHKYVIWAVCHVWKIKLFALVTSDIQLICSVWPNILALEIPIRDWSAAQDDVTLDF